MFHRILIFILLFTMFTGCSSMATRGLTDNLVYSMLNQDDPATVKAAIPAYLLLLDGLIRDQPENPQLLIAASRLYDAFATSLVDESGRSRRLSAHAKKYARKAFCIELPDPCAAEHQDFPAFIAALDTIGRSDLDTLYAYATSYAGWIRINSSDWNSLANMPRVEAMLQHIADLEPGYARGQAQLYLAVLRSQLPASLGGRPEIGQKHFQLAIDYSNGRNLIAKLEYARSYARLVFNRELHDRLLNEVIKANPVEQDLTLSNILAQKKARELLNDGYF